MILIHALMNSRLQVLYVLCSTTLAFFPFLGIGGAERKMQNTPHELPGGTGEGGEGERRRKGSLGNNNTPFMDLVLSKTA